MKKYNYKFCNGWDFFKKTPLRLIEKDDAENIFLSRKMFVGILVYQEENVVGYINAGLMKSCCLDFGVSYFDDNKNRLCQIAATGEYKGLVKIERFSLYGEDRYINIYEKKEDWYLKIYRLDGLSRILVSENNIDFNLDDIPMPSCFDDIGELYSRCYFLKERLRIIKSM